jgi:flagellar motor switch protein FliG
MSDAGVMRSAVLMLSLGEDEAAEVMKFLSPKEVQKLGAAMATLKSVGRDQVETAVTDFLTEAELSSHVGLD